MLASEALAASTISPSMRGEIGAVGRADLCRLGALAYYRQDGPLDRLDDGTVSELGRLLISGGEVFSGKRCLIV